MECKKSAAAYIRVSTEDQVEVSPDSQLAEIRKYAAREGYLLLEDQVYRDEGISGKKAEKRPGFQRMIAAAKEGSVHFDAILVWKFSRFARNQEESIFYKSILRSKCGVEVVSVTEPLIEGPFGSLIERIIEWMDEFYSLRLSQEVKRSMTLNAQKGVRQIAPPFGYRLADGAMIPDDVEAPIVRGIFADFVNGDGCYHIARKLSLAGVTTHRGTPFENRTVDYIICNPTYIGKLRWNPSGRSHRDFKHPDIIIADGTHEPLISTELWEAAQRRRAEIKALWPYSGRSTLSVKFWLQGLIRCASCGATLIWSNPHFIKCNNFVHGRCKTSQHIRWEVVEEIVLAKLETDVSGEEPLNIDLAYRAVPGDNRRELAEKALEQAKSRLRRLTDAYLNAVISLEEFSRSRKELEMQLSAAESSLAAIADTLDAKKIQRDMRADIKSLVTLLRSPEKSTDEKNAAAKELIKACKFDKTAESLEIIYHAFR